jgi:hypothetical protein
MRPKRLTQTLVGAVFVIFLAAMMLFPMGCSKMLPTAPSQEPVQGFTAEELWPKPPADLVGWPQTCSAQASGWVSPADGCNFELQADCFQLEFKVSSDAVNQYVFITAYVQLFNYWWNGEFEKGLRFEFSPDGLLFHKEAKVELEVEVLGAEDGEIVRLYWYNPDTGLWEIEQEEQVKSEKVKLKFNISHFSRYAIS